MTDPQPRPLGLTNANPPGLSLAALIAEDYATHGRDPFSQGFWALFWHRFGNWRMGIRNRSLRLPLTTLYFGGEKLTQWMGGIFLPYTVRIGRRVRIDHFGGMILVADKIGNGAMICANAVVTRDVPAVTVVAGVPARQIGQR